MDFKFCVIYFNFQSSSGSFLAYCLQSSELVEKGWAINEAFYSKRQLLFLYVYTGSEHQLLRPITVVAFGPWLLRTLGDILDD